MKIKKNSVALSQLAKEQIINYINENDIKIDEKLPSEPMLMDMLGVSRYTVREALALLAQEQIVYKIQGKGTFLKRKVVTIESGLEKLESVTETIKAYGYNPGTKWIDIEEVYPTKDMIEKLGVKEDEKVITLKRIRLADGDIASFCIDTIPKSIIGHIEKSEIKTESIFEYLSENCNVIVQSSKTTILPAFLDEEIQNIIGTNEVHKYLLLYQVHYDREGRPIIYSLDYFNSEVIKFNVNRTR